MITTFDRYLLGRMLHTFVMMFIAAYGLYVVFDLFTNIDDFQQESSSLLQLFGSIAEFYLFRVAEFFDMAGPTLIVIAVITVLALLQKNSETYPLLAAGIPTFRLLKPMLIAAGLMNAALICNQEFVLPAIAIQLQTPRGNVARNVQKVEPVYDVPNYHMHIDGDHVDVSTQSLRGASFTLPYPQYVRQICTLKSESAVFVNETSRHPSGWYLKNLTGVFDTEMLTAEGATRVIPHENGRDAFVVSTVTFDQLYNRGRNLKLISSTQLVHRIRNPSTGPVHAQRQSLTLHARITQPLLCLLSISIALPLVIRRESRSLIMNMAVCAAVLGCSYGLTQGCLALGQSAVWMRPDLAAWLPVILNGVAAAWAAGLVQT